MAATFWALIVFIIILDIPWLRGIYIYKGRRKKPCQRDRRLYIYPIQAFLLTQTPWGSIILTYVLFC